MFVLGIDPGVSRCGYGCIRRVGATVRTVAVGVITTPPSDPLPDRLATLDREPRALLAELQPQAQAAGAGAEPMVVAVERLFFQANVRTAMSVGQASGMVLASADGAGCEVVQY
ncbi:MAG: crossover junction endodeoxyribonuclease RuvC, partial [Acidimicrobiales bacterium]